MNSVFRNNETSGFTLLEVLISMAVMVFIAFAIYQATTETYKLRDTLSTEGNFYNSIRLSMTIMQRDINLIYSPLISLPSPSPSTTVAPGLQGQQAQQPGKPNPAVQAPVQGFGDDLNISTNFWSTGVNSIGVRPSRLIGTENKLSFISVSNIRIYKDSPETEFAKVIYELKPDKTSTNSGEMVLVKTVTPNAFADDNEKDIYVHTYELLHGIKKFAFQYDQKDGDTWKKNRSWDSDKDEFKNIYPDIIEIKMQVSGPQKQIFDGIFKFRPEIPLNGLDSST